MLTTVLSFAKSTYSFRVQCTKKGDADYEQVKDLVPSPEVFITQIGDPIVFSGGFYNDYFEAMEAMDEAVDAGADNAFIRVFQNNQYVSDKASEALLRHILNGTLLPKWFIAETEGKTNQKKNEDWKGKTKPKPNYKKQQNEALGRKVVKDGGVDRKKLNQFDATYKAPTVKKVRRVNQQAALEARKNGDLQLASKIESNMKRDSIRRDSIRIEKAKIARAERLKQEALAAAQYTKDSLDSAKVAQRMLTDKSFLKKLKKAQKASDKRKKVEEKEEEKRQEIASKDLRSQMSVVDRRAEIRAKLEAKRAAEKEAAEKRAASTSNGDQGGEFTANSSVNSTTNSDDRPLIESVESIKSKESSSNGNINVTATEVRDESSSSVDNTSATSSKEQSSKSNATVNGVQNSEAGKLPAPKKTKEELKEEKKRKKVIEKLLKEREELAAKKEKERQKALKKIAKSEKKEEKARKKEELARLEAGLKKKSKKKASGSGSSDKGAVGSTQGADVNASYSNTGNMSSYGAVGGSSEGNASSEGSGGGNTAASSAEVEAAANTELEEIIPERLDFTVVEPPIFKILVGKEKIEEKGTVQLAHLPYIIYSENIRKYRYFTTGGYNKYEDALAVLKELKIDERNSKCKVIGTYRGNFVSKKMAVDLANEYRIQNGLE